MKKKQQTESYIRESLWIQSLSSGEERSGRLLRKKHGQKNGGEGAKRVVCLQDPIGFGFDPMGLD